MLELGVMSNWKQIQARIRKARTAPDPVARLSELYAKTRDAMVAFETAAAAEKLTRGEEAIHWYTTASQRFRRAEWKQRANDALLRLGAPIPPEEPAGSRTHEPHPAAPDQEPGENFASPATNGQPAIHALSTLASPVQVPEFGDVFPSEQPPLREVPRLPEAAAPSGSGRRRGRRGGRGRNNRGPAPSAIPPSPQQFAGRGLPSRLMHDAPSPLPPVDSSSPETFAPPLEISSPSAAPASQFERLASRSGDPAFASRLGKLESMLRRLMAGPAHTLDQADEAPAGPGVFLLSDSDLATAYYIESCQTLRVALGNLARKDRGQRGQGISGSDLRRRLAEHLGVNEAKASQYLAKHCVVRWIQLDDEAPHVAYFAIAVLKSPLNIE